MNVFYAPNATTGQFFLPDEEASHCIRVLRLKEQDKISIINGKGDFFPAEIIQIDKRKCLVRAMECVHGYNRHNYQLHLAIAPTKNIDRFEFFLEKAVEIGVDEISPVLCQNSERQKINHERSTKKMIAAAKQSLKANFPVIHPMRTLNEVLDQENNGKKYIAHCREGEKQLLQNLYKPKDPCLVLIGPEGDFSKKELENAYNKGFEPVSLGPHRYRTETAGIIACHTVAMVNN
jgi:16S rRNA (uracil1498-N3)-methyltransferase